MLCAPEAGTNPHSSPGHRRAHRGAIPLLLGLLLETHCRPRQRSHKRTRARTLRVEPSKGRILLRQYSVIQFCRDFCSLQMSGTITIWGLTMVFAYFCLFFLSKAHDKLDWRHTVQHRPTSKRGSKLHEICCLIPGPLDHLSWERLSLPVTNGLWFTALKQH